MCVDGNLDEETILSSMRSYSLVPHIPYRGDMWANKLLLVEVHFLFKVSAFLSLDRYILLYYIYLLNIVQSEFNTVPTTLWCLLQILCLYIETLRN